MERKHRTHYEQFQYWCLAWVGIAEYIVVVLTLGFKNPHWHATFLFSDWMDLSFWDWQKQLWQGWWRRNIVDADPYDKPVDPQQ